MNIEAPMKNYIEFPSREDMKTICQTTNKFFEVDKNQDLIELNANNFTEIQALDPALIVIRRIDGKLAAWSIAFPVKKEIAQRFLSGEITEKEMYDSAMQDKSFETLYYMTAYVNEENRKKGVGIYLAGNQISRLKEDHPEIESIIASAWGDDGKKVAAGLEKKYGLHVDFVDYKHKDN